MNSRGNIPLILIPYPATVPLRGGWALFIERLTRHCTGQGLLVKRLIIPLWFEYGVVWPGLKVGQLLNRGVGTVWALLWRGFYTTIVLWARRLLNGERAICFSPEPTRLAFVGWPRQLCMIGVYSEGPSSKEEAMRRGIWRAAGRQRLG